MSVKAFFCGTLFGIGLAVTATTSAYVIGGSNLYSYNYPSFDKFKPSAPYDRSEFSFNHYRDQVERYVDDGKEYLESANNDMKRIAEAKDEAVENINRVIEEFNNWARRN